MRKLTWTEYLAATDDEWLYDYREDPEEIGYDDSKAAVDAALDDAYPEIPDEVIVYAWALCELPDAEECASEALNSLLESLDEEYGDPDGDATEPTPAMLAAMMTAMSAVLAEYHVWLCDLAAEIVVRREDLPLLWAEFDEAASKALEEDHA